MLQLSDPEKAPVASAEEGFGTGEVSRQDSDRKLGKDRSSI